MDLFSSILFLECLDEIDQNVQTILDKLTTFDGFLAIQFLFKLMHNTRQPQHQTKHVTHSKYTSYINTMTTQKRKETFETTTGKILGYFIFNKTLPTETGNASSLYKAIRIYRFYNFVDRCKTRNTIMCLFRQ